MAASASLAIPCVATGSAGPAGSLVTMAPSSAPGPAAMAYMGAASSVYATASMNDSYPALAPPACAPAASNASRNRSTCGVTPRAAAAKTDSLLTWPYRQFSCTDATPGTTAVMKPLVTQYQSTAWITGPVPLGLTVSCSVRLRTACGVWSMLRACDTHPPPPSPGLTRAPEALLDGATSTPQQERWCASSGEASSVCASSWNHSQPARYSAET
mmetsp:Transcript_21788/g.82878  ORF Transcript_21788/g.82878 Transcript_21788/m.82878 type:complete len:214 (+) Transcript_21788:446-1087(+)